MSHWTILRTAQEEADHRCERWWSWVLMIWVKTVRSLGSAWATTVRKGHRRGGGVSRGFIAPCTGRPECVQRCSLALRCRIPLKLGEISWKCNTIVLILLRMGQTSGCVGPLLCRTWEEWGVHKSVGCCMFTAHRCDPRPGVWTVYTLPRRTKELLFSCFLLLFYFFFTINYLLLFAFVWIF